MRKAGGRFLPYVAVDWVDAHTLADRSWQALKDVDTYHREPVICTTIGMLVKKDRRGLTLAMSTTSGGQVGGLWHVPAGMVRRVRRLKRW